MAEGLVPVWAAQCGYAANRATKDATGWDYLLEFHRPPLPQGTSRSLDHEPAALAAFLQVKGTDWGTSVEMKLDSLKRFIDWPIPAFLLAVVYQGADDPQSAYLVEVDEALVGRVLKRLREIPEEQHSKLHQQTLRISWEPAHRLHPLDGHGLRERIVERIGSDPSSYAATKRGWVKTLGYEKRPFSARIEVLGPAADRAEEVMVDFALGLIDRLPARLTNVTETRFGVSKSVPDQFPDDTESYVQVENLPSVATAAISLRSGKRGVAVDFACRLYDPRVLLPDLPRRLLRQRFVSDYIEFILHMDEGRWNFSTTLPSSGEKCSLEAVAKCAQLLLLLEEAHEGDDLEIAFSIDGGTEARIRVERASVRLNTNPAVVAMYRNMVDAWRVAQYANLPLNTQVSLGALADHADSLRDCRMLIDPPTGAEISMTGRMPGPPGPAVPVGYPIVTGGQIGNRLVIVGAAVCGVPEYTEIGGEFSAFRVGVPSVRIVLKEVVLVAGEGAIAVDPYLARVRDWIAANGMVVLPSSPDNKGPSCHALPEPATGDLPGGAV